MKNYGIELAEGSEITNLTVAVGTSFPDNPNAGELFYRLDTHLLYVYTTSWVAVGGAGTIHGYIHTQTTSSSVWTVVHNFDSTNIQFSVYVNIDTIQTAVLPANTVFVDNNTTQFHFSQPQTGKAILTKVG